MRFWFGSTPARRRIAGTVDGLHLLLGQPGEIELLQNRERDGADPEVGGDPLLGTARVPVADDDFVGSAVDTQHTGPVDDAWRQRGGECSGQLIVAPAQIVGLDESIQNGFLARESQRVDINEVALSRGQNLTQESVAPFLCANWAMVKLSSETVSGPT